MFWQKRDSIYYMSGVADSNYCVVKFTADSGRLYLNFTATHFGIYIFHEKSPAG